MVKLFILIVLVAGGFYAYEHYFGPRPPAPRLSPEGTVFTLDRASAQSDTGLVGIPPGAELNVISRGPSESTVEYRGHRVTLPNSSVTRDLDAVEAIRRDEADKRRKASLQPVAQPPASKPKPNPKLEELKKDLLRVQDRLGDARYQLKQTTISIEEHRSRGTAETAASQSLMERQRSMQFELERLTADEERVQDLIRREMRGTASQR